MAITDPHVRGVDLDNIHFMDQCYEQIRRKSFLNRIYREWYRHIAGALPASGTLLEIGSGYGFLRDYIPGLICSDIKIHPRIDTVVDAMQLPFADASLDGIALMNALHHVRDPRLFFSEAARTVKSGGTIAMIEPWVSPWSKFVYTYLHHEPFLWKNEEWSLPAFGKGHANGAVPWIIFKRDRAVFEHEFPAWKIQSITPIMPIAYVLSGGLSMRALMPGWTYKLWRVLEWPFERSLCMFAIIVLKRR